MEKRIKEIPETATLTYVPVFTHPHEVWKEWHTEVAGMSSLQVVFGLSLRGG